MISALACIIITFSLAFLTASFGFVEFANQDVPESPDCDRFVALTFDHRHLRGRRYQHIPLELHSTLLPRGSELVSRGGQYHCRSTHVAWCACCAQNALQVVHQRVARLEDFVYLLQLSRSQSGMRQYALTCCQVEYLVQNGI